MDISNMILARSAKRLKEVRKSSGFNQKQFAEKFEANPSTYNRYESGSTDTIPPQGNILHFIQLSKNTTGSTV